MTKKPEGGFAPQPERESAPKIEKLTPKDIKPVVPEPRETTIVLQRHAHDNRDPETEDYGLLYPDSAEMVRSNAETYFKEIFESLSEDEREKMDVLVVASNTYLEPKEDGTKHMRAVYTANEVVTGLKAAMEEFQIPDQNYINNTTSGGEPTQVTEIQEPKMFEETPKFVEFLREKYGTGLEFWQAYENDVEIETRLKMGAEGPDEMANRLKDAIATQAEEAQKYHKVQPGKRLIIWDVTHYDTISPFTKQHVAGMEQTSYLPVENGAGISISLDKDGQATAGIQGKEYDIDL